VISRLLRICPTLFDLMLPTAERPEDDKSLLELKGDEMHKFPAAIRCVQRKYVRETLCLPLSGKSLDDPTLPFSSSLRAAYLNDYNMPNVVDLGRLPVQWCQQVSFTNPFAVPSPNFSGLRDLTFL
jgi:hypothetical protein